MKICLVFVLTGLAFTSGWIFYEKPFLTTPILLLRHASRLASLNLPRLRNIGNDRVGRHVPLNESPPMCIFKGPCKQLYHRNHFQLKNLFEAEPVFRNNYDSLYPRRMKGRQAPQQSRVGFAARNGLIYMTPSLMIVRPVSAPLDPPPRKSAYSGFREVLFTKPAKGQETKPEDVKNENQTLFRAFTEIPQTSKEKAIPDVESKRIFTEVSAHEAKRNSTSESSFHDVRPSSVRPYAVKEVIDDIQPAAANGTKWYAGKSLLTPNGKDEKTAEARRKTNANSRVMKIIPLADGNKIVGKNLQNATSHIYPTSTDHFLRIIPSQNSQRFNQKPKEFPINRKEQSKNFKIASNWQESAIEGTADNRSGSRIISMSTPGVKNRENFRGIEITPAAVDTTGQNPTAEIKYFSPATKETIKGYLQKGNHVSTYFTPEREFKIQQKSDKQAVAPFKIAATPEVTFKVLEVENVTDVPEEFTVTWKFQNDPSPTAKEGNTMSTNVMSTNLTTTEGFTEHPLNSDLLTPGADLKKESFLKNSRKMHFGQESLPSESLDQDPRRSDILISDNFDEYFDEEVNLSYLEKLKRNNSLDSLRDLSSNTLIPLIPVVIQDLRQGKIPPEDISLLSAAFGDRWKTVLELSNSTDMDMLPILKMKDESDLKDILQSISHSVESTTTETTFAIDYESYDYMEKFRDLYEDLLTVGQEIEGDKSKRSEKGSKVWKRSGNVSENLRAKRQG